MLDFGWGIKIKKPFKARYVCTAEFKTEVFWVCIQGVVGNVCEISTVGSARADEWKLCCDRWSMVWIEGTVANQGENSVWKSVLIKNFFTTLELEKKMIKNLKINSKSILKNET